MSVLEIKYEDREELAAWEAYPEMPQGVKLLDGTVVMVRPICPDDASRLQALLGRLSRNSIYLRFLEYRKQLSKTQAERLSTIDYQSQMALVAVDEQEEIIAVARYAVVQPDRPDHAEAAVVVEDRYHGRGLGMLLLKWLMTYARAHGVRSFVATVHPNNTQILRFIDHSGLPAEKSFVMGVWDIEVKLDPPSIDTHRQRNDSER